MSQKIKNILNNWSNSDKINILVTNTGKSL